MKIKTNELRDTPLAWAVAKALELKIDDSEKTLIFYEGEPFLPDTYWQQGGPIIEQQGIALYLYGDSQWNAHVGGHESIGPTALIAAMRCFVASKLGDEIDLPADLALDCLIYETGDE